MTNQIQRRRDFCFTINNPELADLENLTKIWDSAKLQYLLYGREVGENGTPHLQGYLYYKQPASFNIVKTALGRAHIEPCRGTADDNITYCKKDGDFVERGKAPISQKRKGDLGREYWENQLSLAKKGKIEECDPKLQITHWNSLNRIAARYAPMPEDNEDITNDWYWGPTGTGKSFKARSENPGFYLKMCNKWWDGYNNEDTAIIEDFDKTHHMLGHHLKIWGDRYAFPAEIKGSKTNIRPKKVIVTSNFHPQDIWTNDPPTLEPIIRRFHITHFNSGLNPS